MFRLFPSVVRPKHVLVAVAVAVLLIVTLVPSRPQPAFATGTCDPLLPHATGNFPNETITTLDGLEREYILTVPSSYDGGVATPLVFNFHGFGSQAIEQDVYSQLPQTAEAEGFILVTPQGTLNAQGQRFWNSSQSPPPVPDDVGFVGQLLTSLQSQLCIDLARVFSTGLSNGGFMSSRLACVLSNRIAAIAPVAGTAFYGSCDARPVPVIAFHGTEDNIVSLGPIETIAIPAWATHNNCGGPVEQDPVPPTTGVRLTRYDGCDEDATVELYVIFDVDTGTAGDQGGGHTWPGSTFVLPPAFKAVLGQTTLEISANDLMWDFFLAHPHPLLPKAVGGLAVDLNASDPGLPLETLGSSGSSPGLLASIVVATMAAALALGGAAWYARRRWAR